MTSEAGHVSRDLARRNDPEYLLSTSSRNRHSLSIIYTLFLKKRDSSFVTFRFVFVRLSSPQGRWRVHRLSPRFHDLSLVYSHDQRTRSRLFGIGRADQIARLLLQQRQPNQSHNFIVYYCYLSNDLSSKHARAIATGTFTTASARCSPSRRNSSRYLVLIGLI